MSTLKTTNIQNASSATTNIALDTSGNVTVGNNVTVGGGITASSGTVVMSSPYTMRNKIINGAMVIDQRYAGASLTSSSSGYYIVDRWAIQTNQASRLTIQQNQNSVTPPAGFSNYLGITVASAYTPASTDYTILDQVIEGYNISDLNWGSASALTVTLSFWARSSLTGTFSGSLSNGYGGSLSYPYTFTISSANTWEYKTIVIPGPTSGSWASNSNGGIYLYFDIGSGSSKKAAAGSWSSGAYYGATGATSIIGTASATFYITGVQLERGTVATPFEYRNYQQELAMCQRYFQRINGPSSNNSYFASGVQAGSTTSWSAYFNFITTMRAAPTFTNSGGGITDGYSFGNAIASITNFWPTTYGARVDGTNPGGGAAGRVTFFYLVPGEYVSYSSEL